MYLYGTYEAMPKGSNLIKSRDIGARIGRYIPPEELDEMTKGLPRSEAYRLIAAFVRHQVLSLRDGTRADFNALAMRELWKIERRNQANEAPDSSEDHLVTAVD
jgi:long-chain acyl-CoA synthetase